MKTRVGVWIDHRKAVIVVVTDTGEEIRLIISQTKAAPPCWGFPAAGAL